MGGDVIAIYSVGGSTGQLLHRLVEREKIQSIVIEIAEETREDFTVTEEKSGQQYRFVLPGAPLRESEWRECLDAVARVESALFLVASASIAKRIGAKTVLDTSGTALVAALNEGVYLVKPNLRELQEIANVPLSGPDAWVEASRRLVASGRAEVVALSLGHRGALLTTVNGTLRAHAPDVHVVSAVGAGDSFLAGIVWQLACGAGLVEAFRYGVAAGSAAVLNPGTELCHPANSTFPAAAETSSSAGKAAELLG